MPRQVIEISTALGLATIRNFGQPKHAATALYSDKTYVADGITIVEYREFPASMPHLVFVTNAILATPPAETARIIA